jgi:peroxiredoxin Q/BCP
MRARLSRYGAPLLVVACAAAAGTARAQQPAQKPAQAPAPAATPANTFPVVGDVAPDFALPGATRYGLLRDPVRLSDYRGQTVVLAFFFKARTKG